MTEIMSFKDFLCCNFMKRLVVSIELSLFITEDYFQNYKSITSMYQCYKHKSLTKVFKIPSLMAWVKDD